MNLKKLKGKWLLGVLVVGLAGCSSAPPPPPEPEGEYSEVNPKEVDLKKVYLIERLSYGENKNEE